MKLRGSFLSCCSKMYSGQIGPLFQVGQVTNTKATNEGHTLAKAMLTSVTSMVGGKSRSCTRSEGSLKVLCSCAIARVSTENLNGWDSPRPRA